MAYRSHEDVRLPAAYWEHFTQTVAPFMDGLSGGRRVREIEAVIHFDDSSAFRVGPALQDIDMWFRWAYALDRARDSAGGRPPRLLLLQPVSPKEFTFRIVRTEEGSLRVRLRSGMSTALIGAAAVGGLLEFWNNLTGVAPLGFMFDDGARRELPAAPREVKEQEKGIFGVREGGRAPDYDDGEFEITLEGDVKVTCKVRIPSRVVEADSEFMKEFYDACAQFDDGS
ncbi:hypothetical protein [Streptomyces sp. NPDC004435]|uniref:hypothetical protein n=1 Tax=Streptomyces sp. NPDC004435 TaxID=3364701 RepID=UPI0036BE8DA9